MDKLVRDEIPTIIENKGQIPNFEILNKYKYRKELGNKLLEESNEFIKDQNQEELADLLEVIYAICDEYGFYMSNIEHMREQKRNRLGGFDRRILLKSVD